MAWQTIEQHDEIVERFRRARDRGRLAHTFLFVGPPGVGKRSFAFKLAETLLCQSPDAERNFAPCGTCASCIEVHAGTHPDLEYIAKPDDKSTIPLELLIGSGEKRMQEGLCRRLALKPFLGGRRVAIIDDADFLNVEGANCLLKTLEEPPPRSVLILLSENLEAQLPTIRSRSQVIRFRPLSDDLVSRLLTEQAVVETPEEARRLALFSAGSLSRARELADPALWNFRAALLKQLSTWPIDSLALAREVASFVEEAGKEAPARRRRARLAADFSVELGRQLARQTAGATRAADEPLAVALTRLARLDIDADTALALVDRTLEWREQIDRNVHLPTAIEAWAVALSVIARRVPAGRA